MWEPSVLIALGSLLVAALALAASTLRSYASDTREGQMVSDRLDSIAEAVTHLTAIVEGMDGKLDTHADSIARVQEQVKALASRVDSVEDRVRALEGRR